MKPEYYEDFATVLQYFNVKDLQVQTVVHESKNVGEEFMNIELDGLSEDQLALLFETITDGNPALKRPISIELLEDIDDKRNWYQQLLTAFKSFYIIKQNNLKSTLNLRFPAENKRIEHILKNLFASRFPIDRYEYVCFDSIGIIFFKNFT